MKTCSHSEKRRLYTLAEGALDLRSYIPDHQDDGFQLGQRRSRRHAYSADVEHRSIWSVFCFCTVRIADLWLLGENHCETETEGLVQRSHDPRACKVLNTFLRLINQR